MTKRQYNHASRIIARDCMTCGEYIEVPEDRNPFKACDTKTTCAIGALALAAGVKPILLWKHNESGITADELRPVVRRIHATFGLEEKHLIDIQAENDGHFSPGRRRRAILRYLKQVFIGKV